MFHDIKLTNDFFTYKIMEFNAVCNYPPAINKSNSYYHISMQIISWCKQILSELHLIWY